MSDDKIKRLEAMSGIGKNVRFKKKEGGGSTHMGVVDDEVYIMVGDYKHLLQKIKFNPGVFVPKSNTILDINLPYVSVTAIYGLTIREISFVRISLIFFKSSYSSMASFALYVVFISLIFYV